ncbi:EF-hand [Hymenopellis radicata]|nr:EF-hand [Hymenopellis radicata]
MSRYPSTLAPNTTLTKAQKSRARREPSGVFTQFQPAQIQQFKEAFQMIDHNKDGWVGESDLKEIFGSLAAELSTRRIGRGEKGVNFTMFLTMMSERLFEFDTEHELVEAFACFDENDSGLVKVDEMRRWLSDVGDRMDEREMDRLLKGPYTDRQGNFNYREWVKVLRVNEEE